MADLLLGAAVDPATGDRGDALTTIPTKDLVTHGVIVGMTGSGKTGLGVALIEEVLAAGIPALLIDPKGDLTNLALVFPTLSGADFRPWVDESQAEASGLGADAFADAQAELWGEGLAGWGLGPTQLSTLDAAAAVTIYTPGSSAGVGLNLLGSLQAPPPGAALEDTADEIQAFASTLLDMLDLNADPLTSREHILISTIIHQAWTQGTSLDLPTLLAHILQPPFRTLGVLDLDTAFPPADRQAFGLRLNGLLASPTFAQWTKGEPLDIERLLHGEDGKPRCAVITTSHLSDAERQSVTALVLAKLITWMRRQSGVSDLRALLYMDEVAGYLPPTANPPTKKPIMLLLKQARAFGLGVVLSTQNPVDMDYKALGNAGTWLVGRLQTEQDKSRLLDGLTSADGGVDVAAASSAISALGKRQFLLRRADGTQEVLATRWAMSYLRGPLTREQIAAANRLSGVSTAAPAPASGPAAATTPAGSPPLPPPTGAPMDLPGVPTPEVSAASAVTPASASSTTPIVPAVSDQVGVAWLDPAAGWASLVGAIPGTRFRAVALARVHLRYDDTKADLLHDEEYEALLSPLPQLPDATGFVPVDYDARDLLSVAPSPANYEIPDGAVETAAWWRNLEKSLDALLVRSKPLTLSVNKELTVYSRPGETAEQFAARCVGAADQRADDAVAALRTKYEAKLRTARDRLTDAGAKVQTLQGQHDAQFASSVAGAVGSMLGGLFGGRSSRASVSGIARKQASSSAKVEAAQTKAASLEQTLSARELELAHEVAELDTKWAAKAASVEAYPVSLEASDVQVLEMRLVWVPVG